jgi:ribosomal protein S8
MLLYSSLAILNQAIKHKSSMAKIPFSRKGYELVKLLYKNGYINSYYVDLNVINIFFKFYENNLVLNGFFFYSKPGHIKSISFNQLRKAYVNKNKIYILSTINGICTSLEALQMHLGGIILAEINN